MNKPDPATIPIEALRAMGERHGHRIDEADREGFPLFVEQQAALAAEDAATASPSPVADDESTLENADEVGPPEYEPPGES